MGVRVIREITDKGYRARMCLVERNPGEFFAVSSVNALFSGPETLVFPADSDGNVTSWLEVAGGRGVSRDEAIAELEGD